MNSGGVLQTHEILTNHKERTLRSLFHRERVERELDEELHGFAEMAVEEKMKRGMSRQEALRAVRLERGGIIQSMMCVSLATPGTKACDAGGGAVRQQWREWPEMQV